MDALEAFMVFVIVLGVMGLAILVMIAWLCADAPDLEDL